MRPRGEGRLVRSKAFGDWTLGGSRRRIAVTCQTPRGATMFAPPLRSPFCSPLPPFAVCRWPARQRSRTRWARAAARHRDSRRPTPTRSRPAWPSFRASSRTSASTNCCPMWRSTRRPYALRGDLPRSLRRQERHRQVKKVLKGGSRPREVAQGRQDAVGHADRLRPPRLSLEDRRLGQPY